MYKGSDSSPFEKKDIVGDVYGIEIKERDYA
jgi:hypothetical protein